ncbi:MAG: 4,5-DOPA dioxygenase extradiol [Bacteroidota bacterium]
MNLKRKQFIKLSSLLVMNKVIPLNTFYETVNQFIPDSAVMPAIFIGHGSPMNAIADNAFTQSLSKLANHIPKPKAILVVSAHWLTRGTYVASTSQPKTIYDFGGFAEELYRIKYPAPGSPDFAELVKNELSSIHAQADSDMGFDHGTWSILRHMYPQADIPTFQLSIDYTKPAEWHYKMAAQLASLRTKGLLIVGSGNIVHNLGMIKWDSNSAKAYDWAIEFDENVKRLLIDTNHTSLIHYTKLGKAAQLAVPTNDHYLPMLYINGVQQKNDAIAFTYEGIDMGSISMLCIVYQPV